MSKLVNISRNPDDALYVEAGSITMIAVDEKQKELALFDENKMFLHIRYEKKSGDGWSVDPAQVVQAAEEAQGGFVRFPIRWPDVETGQTKYVAPAAIVYMTVSKPDDQGFHGVIMGIHGVGREESYKISKVELEEIVQAMKAVPGKKVIEISSDEAGARWAVPERLYLDPSTLTILSEDGHGEVVAQWEKAGRLDIHVARVDINKIATQLHRDNPEMDLRQVFALAAEYGQDSKGKELAAKLAAAQGGELVAFSGAVRHVYLAPDKINIAYVQSLNDGDKHKIYIQRRATESNPYPDPIFLDFKDAVKRDTALQALRGAMGKKKPSAQIKPPTAP